MKPDLQIEIYAHKAIYLNMEHEELTEEFEQIRRDFVSEMFEYCSKKIIIRRTLGMNTHNLYY